MDSTTIPSILNACRVLVCRPEPGASELSDVLNSVGAECLKLPMLETRELNLTEQDKQRILNLDEYQHIIVVSQHAAQIALSHIDQYWPQMPVNQSWYPIGRKTQSILQDYGIECIEPEGDMTSEDLLALPCLQDIKEDKVLLIKGKAGRDLIKNRLEKKAKQFDSLSLYERIMPGYQNDEFKRQFTEFSPEFIVALSGETLENLIQLSAQCSIDLSNKSFILSSNRVANIAYEAGIKKVHIPKNLKPIDIIKSIKHVLKSENTGK